MKIAILGGSFDPMTEAHLAMAEKVIEEGVADKVLIVPTIVDYHKPSGHKSWLLPGDRLMVIGEMIKRSVCREHIEIDCSDYDALDRIRPEYRPAFQSSRRFIHTLIAVKEKYPEGTEFFFILGTDQAGEFQGWFQYEDILKLAKPIVFNGRAGRFLELSRIFAPYEFAELKLASRYGLMSSTKIREEMKGKSASYYLDHIGEELIARTPIFDLVRKPEVQAGFRPVGLNCPDWVMVVAKDDCQENYLMVRQLRYGLMKEIEEFVCGQVEPGEDPVHAALRELKEETGYDVKDDREDSNPRVSYLGKLPPNPAFQNNWIHVVLVHLAGLEPKKQDLDEHERIEVLWKDGYEVESNPSTALMAAGLYLLDHSQLSPEEVERRLNEE